MKRLGLDIGTNSIGWALFDTQNGEVSEIIDLGVRIFSSGRDPKTRSSLAVDRRDARSMRRRRDRYLKRRTALMRKLADSGLMPSSPGEAKTLELLDPYELRARGLDEKLPITHLGRALFHLNQRRGFKSNRKTDRGDNESNKILDAAANLDQDMMACKARTLGEFQHFVRRGSKDRPRDPREVPSVRTRLGKIGTNEKGKDIIGYNHYPMRRHTEEEFDMLWKAQARHHPELTDDLRDTVREIILFQRPLKQPKIGRCRYYDEERIPKAHPLGQRRVLLETVNSLRISSPGQKKRELTLEERDRIVHALDNKKPTESPRTMKFALTRLAKLLDLAPDERFTLESIHRDSISCDPVRASLSHRNRFGPSWSKLDFDSQWDVIRRIRNVESDSDAEELTSWLEDEHGLSAENAREVLGSPLPDGYGSLGETVTRQLVDRLERSVITYAKAVEECGLHHSSDRTGEVLEALPYYGRILDRHVIPGTGDPADDDIARYGRITNPTVHIGLNQLRRLVNAIIAEHGVPGQIVVELSRDLKQSEKQRKDAQRRILDNTKAAEARSEKLRELGQTDNGYNRALLRLFEELNKDDCMKRFCPYSGERISVKMLFDGSCDVDHILPYSRTLDDSFANRTLCIKAKNAEKGNKSPYEAWGATDQWNGIRDGLKFLPANKRWRFEPDAMERFDDENDFLDRALRDTQYLSRIAQTYLDALYTEGGNVWVVPGRLTEMLRRKWGLNSLLSDKDGDVVKEKNRTDHRHHAIDASVVAATDRGTIQRIQRASGKDEERGAEEVARTIEAPWKSFRADLGSAIEGVVVSHRADHGRIDRASRKHGRDSTAGKLHNDTAYGIVNEQEVVSRVPLLSLGTADIQVTTKGKNIRDPHLQRELENATKGKEGNELEAALREFAMDKDSPHRGIRRVRMIINLSREARFEIADGEAEPYKAYKKDSNHCLELWRVPKGAMVPKEKIVVRVVSTIDAHTGGGKRPHPAAKRLLRVFKKDMVAVERDGQTKIYCLHQFFNDGRVILALHNEANADARNRDGKDPFTFLSLSGGAIVKARMRRVHVDVLGKVRDPGSSLYDQ